MRHEMTENGSHVRTFSLQKKTKTITKNASVVIIIPIFFLMKFADRFFLGGRGISE